tara:strand:+ start:230 stop:1291 length:1062 start_codon:yes stop_codon:yes gene_type:complete
LAILLTTKDPFVEGLDGSSDDLAFKEANVRRPLEGMLRKPDRHAFLSIYRMDGSEFKHVSILDSSAPGKTLSSAPGKTLMDNEGYSDATHNFLLKGVAHTKQEKVQIVETFGPFYAFFYGEKPTVIQCNGVLLNSPDFNWKNEWLRNYDLYLRGTRCVEFKARVYLGFDDVLVQGYILGTNVQYNDQFPSLCPFSFSMLVTGYKDLSEGNDEYLTAGWQGRSLTGEYVEYLKQMESVSFQYVDMATGELKDESGSSIDVPDSAGNTRTASWAGDASTGKLWREPGDALSAIDTELAIQQTGGSDKVTAQIQRRKAPSSFPLASRDGNSESLGNALSSGVSNCACVISDHPTIG